MPVLSTKFLPDSVLNTIKRSRPVYAIARRIRFGIGSALGSRTVPGLSGLVHYNDFMLTTTGQQHVQRYSEGARLFVNIIERALRDVGRDWPEVEAVLDIGCGYGRIVRELSKKLPGDRIYVTDVITEGANFTASQFGAHKISLVEQLGPEWNQRFDLIYLCTVYTNMRVDFIKKNLRRVEALLKPGGIIVFSIQGQGSADSAEQYQQYWLDKNKVLEDLARVDYYFGRYPHYSHDYGLSWFTKVGVENFVSEAAPSLRAVSFRPMELDGHQDMYVYQKFDTAVQRQGHSAEATSVS